MMLQQVPSVHWDTDGQQMVELAALAAACRHKLKVERAKRKAERQQQQQQQLQASTSLLGMSVSPKSTVAEPAVEMQALLQPQAVRPLAVSAALIAAVALPPHSSSQSSATVSAAPSPEQQTHSLLSMHSAKRTSSHDPLTSRDVHIDSAADDLVDGLWPPLHPLRNTSSDATESTDTTLPSSPAASATDPHEMVVGGTAAPGSSPNSAFSISVSSAALTPPASVLAGPSNSAGGHGNGGLSAFNLAQAPSPSQRDQQMQPQLSAQLSRHRRAPSSRVPADSPVRLARASAVVTVADNVENVGSIASALNEAATSADSTVADVASPPSSSTVVNTVGPPTSMSASTNDAIQRAPLSIQPQPERRRIAILRRA